MTKRVARAQTRAVRTVVEIYRALTETRQGKGPGLADETKAVGDELGEDVGVEHDDDADDGG